MCHLATSERYHWFLLLWVIASTSFLHAQDGGEMVRQRLADPGFRLLADEADGMRWVAETLELTDPQKEQAYAWLRDRAKVEQDLGLECRMLAWLARELHRPAEETAKADDLVLRVRPGLAEVWVRRAEDHVASQRPEAEAWAVESYVQGLRRAPLASPSWLQILRGEQGLDWLSRAAKAGQAAAWARALGDALRDTPLGQARLDTAALVLAALKLPETRATPAVAVSLLEAVQETQPQVVLGDVMGFVEAMRAADRASQLEISHLISRLLTLAPVPADVTGSDDETGVAFAQRWEAEHPPTAGIVEAKALPGTLAQARQMIEQQQWDAARANAAALRAGYRTLLTTWEDTSPRYQPFTLANEVRRAAMGPNREAFATEALEAAKAGSWNENLVSHALIATALTTGLDKSQMTIATRLTTAARGRVALRLHAFAPADKYPSALPAQWVEEAVLETVQLAKGLPMERSTFESLLLSMECLNQAASIAALERVLKAAVKTPPRVVDVEHWQRLSAFVVSSKNAMLADEFSQSWLSVLTNARSQREHLPVIAAAAVQGGATCGGSFARAALTLWTLQYGVSSDTTPPEPGTASRVAEAQVTCGDLEGFSTLVSSLRTLGHRSPTSVLGRMSAELSALDNLIKGEPGTRPAVDAWVQAPASPDEPPRLHWQLVLPELGTSAAYPLIITTGDRDSREAWQKLRDARWWRAGTALPVLASLSGKFDLHVFAGDSLFDMPLITTISDADSKGSAALKGLLPAGYLRVDLHSGAQPLRTGEPRPYSLLPSVTATGREPDAVGDAPKAAIDHPQAPPVPASWQPEDVARWGRLATPPVAIQPGMEYLLAQWPASPTELDPMRLRMILLDENQKPLGPVPLASTGPARGRPMPLDIPPVVARRARLQLFRPGDWEGDGDLVSRRGPNGVAAGMMEARYMAFVTPAKANGPLPLLQLRPYKEGPTTPAPSTVSRMLPCPELNDEPIADVGFWMHSWHVTFASDRAVIGGKGELMAFDITHIPWKPLVRSTSPLLEGNEWPMCFDPARAMVIEPSWSGNRDLGLRFVPLDQRGERYAACERLVLPLPNYNRGELSEQGAGAVLMASSKPGDHPEPVCAWVEPDGRCHVVPLPRPPLTGKPGLELAWWGPEGSRFTLYEDGLLFEMEHLNTLRLVSVRPGSPDDIPEGADAGRSRRKREWALERPDLLVQKDKKTGMVVRRFHLATPCEGRPITFDRFHFVLLCTTEHEIIRVNPPPINGD